jgi:hypothetical protein
MMVQAVVAGLEHQPRRRRDVTDRHGTEGEQEQHPAIDEVPRSLVHQRGDLQAAGHSARVVGVAQDHSGHCFDDRTQPCARHHRGTHRRQQRGGPVDLAGEHRRPDVARHHHRRERVPDPARSGKRAGGQRPLCVVEPGADQR